MITATAAGTLAYVANLVTIFALYPYRDFVKCFDMVRMSRINVTDFCMSRYRGMLRNPSQPLLLATPPSLLYFGYVLGSGGIMGIIWSGLLAGYAKIFIGTVARRMSVSSRYNRLGQHSYSSCIDCILSSTKHYGILSFFVGGLASSLIALSWHGISLAVLQQTYGTGFFCNTWNAFRTHAFMTFVTAPLRNMFRSSMAQRERPGGVHSVRVYVAGEAAIFREALGVLQTMWRVEGVKFFLQGVVRTTFKVSMPFAVSYGFFKALGGSIGSPTYGSGSGHLGGRRFLRHY